MCIERETNKKQGKKEKRKRESGRKKQRKKRRLTLGKAIKVPYCIYRPFRVSQFQISLCREDWLFRLRA